MQDPAPTEILQVQHHRLQGVSPKGWRIVPLQPANQGEMLPCLPLFFFFFLFMCRSSHESHVALLCSSHFAGFSWQLFEPTDCGNGFVEVGEECDCGERAVSYFFSKACLPLCVCSDRRRFSAVCFQECYKECCKKCSLANGAHCSDGPCCNTTCLV